MSGTYKSPYRPDANSADVLKNVDIRGKCVVVTGGTDGLGRETLRALAAVGAEVLFTTRNHARGQAVVDSVKAETAGAAIEAMFCDLMSMESVDAFNLALRQRAPKIDALILNAGILAPALTRNAQGLESQFMTNVLSHFMIAAAAAPALIAAAPSRMVFLTSSLHKTSPFLFDDYNFERLPYDQFTAYGHTKTAASLLAVEFNRRLARKGVLAFSVHPGSIFETGLATHMRADNDQATIEMQVAAMNLAPGDRKTLAQGAATSVWAATDPGLAASGGGLYLENVDVGVISDEPSPFRYVAPHALDPEAAQRLWSVMETCIGRNVTV